jgi:hypothetical protein
MTTPLATLEGLTYRFDFLFASPMVVLQNAWPLAVIAAATFTLAGFAVRRAVG